MLVAQMDVPGVKRVPRAVDAYLAIGAVAIGLYYLAAANSVVQTVAYSAVGVYGIAGLLVGACRNLQGAARRPWYLFAAGLIAFVIGDSIFDAYAIGSGTVPFPSAADWIYLAAYPILFAAIALLIARSAGRRARGAVIDAGIVTCAFVLAQWVFVLAPAAGARGSVVDRSILVAYPAMDILIVAPLAGLIYSRAARSASYVLLALAILTLLVADEVYYGHGVNYRWLDAFWLASYVLWGAAALHPSVARLGAQSEEARPRLGRGRLALLGAAVATAPVVLAVQTARSANAHPYAVAGFGTAISALVLLRLAALLRSFDAVNRAERQLRIDAEASRLALIEQNERLRELDRLKDEFVGLVSHDLRTPLTSITGYVELLEADETGPLNAEQRSFLKIVSRNAGRLLRLVNDLLFVARLQSGRLELDLDEVDLSVLAAEAVAGAGPHAGAKGLDLELVSSGDTAVLGEPGRLAQLLDNLVSNAIKFTPDGGSVTLRVAAEDGAVVLEVSDSGIGIPESERARLFERFFRASTAVSRQIPGTGLGLHIAQAIVEAHGGRITVASKVGAGTTFRVELPPATVVAEVHA
jgi:signal transduction histidine kinase